uniref:tRNA-ribosyltransferase n=1 Tax=Ignisphaera aggregans TaxID=334771 RepID=A0A7C4FGG7_9CREN
MPPEIVFGVPDVMIKLWEYMPSIKIMINSIRWRWDRPSVEAVWVDSGGYQIMIKGLKIDINEVIERYRKIDGDYFMSLDIPPHRFCQSSKELVEKNIKYFEYLYTKLEKNIVPVIHCYESTLLLDAIDVYKSYGVKVIAYGGAVPPSLAKGGKGSRTTPLIPLAIITKAFNGYVHVLGLGGTSVLYTALQNLRVASLDSSSWRVKAAYGKVIIPGRGERYVGNGSAKFGRKDLLPEDYDMLVKALEQTGFPYVNDVEVLLRTFRGRALINAWVVRYYPHVLEKTNGYTWIVSFAKKLSNMGVDELIALLDRRSKSLHKM